MDKIEQKKLAAARTAVEKILRTTIDWDQTVYHGDVTIMNIGKAADKIIKYFKPKLRGKKNV